MHRLNTLFVGRAFHHLPSVGSTNDHALRLLSKSKPPEGTVISAHEQYAGRGQIGSRWESQAGLSLTVSIILYPDFLLAQNQFLLNQAVALAVADVVATHFQNASIKWPNDVFVGDRKVAGILLQNTVTGSHLRASVVGIGLNVNQTEFSENAPNPTSFKLLSGNDFPLDETATLLCQRLEQRYLNLKAGKIIPLQAEYLQRLFRLNEPGHFQRENGEIFQGKIIGVSPIGKLKIKVQGTVEEFDLKQVKLLVGGNRAASHQPPITPLQ